jgi:hypothetical protein
VKALSFRQPWARAVKCGAKRIETRSWRTTHRGSLLIHASAKFGKADREAEMALMMMGYIPVETSLQRGGLIAMVKLLDCVKVETIRHRLSPRELALGDYSDGRWAWLLTNPKSVKFTPCSGTLGVWDYQP